MEGNVKLTFAAIDRVVEQNIPLPKESEDRGKNYIYWGDANDYPVFLHKLYLECPTLQTIINGTTDYVVGNGVSCGRMEYPNRKMQTWDELFTLLAADYLNFGICFLQVIRNNKGEVSEFYHLDTRYVRSDYKNEMFFYNEDFVKKYSRASKTLIYPKFIKDAVDVPASVICIKTPHSRGVYGTPIWGSAVKSVVTEIEIDNFHLSELENNFAGSAIINFPNGQPSEDEMDEIEKRIREKFIGSNNAGTFLLNFCNGKDNAATIERLAGDDFDKRYDSLAKKTQQQIFVSFGANPNLFGVATESNGFNSEEYNEAFKLYNRTRVRPIQGKFCDAIDKALGEKGVMTIKPFSLIDNNEDNVK